MRERFLVSLMAGVLLAACATGGGSEPARSNQDRELQERAAAVTAPIGPPPQSSGEEVALEAANDPEPPTEPGAIVVPGQREPTPLPPGDPRTVDQRMTDIRAWDRCIMRAQAQMTDGQPGRPQDSPEEVCRRALGMADREAVPFRE